MVRQSLLILLIFAALTTTPSLTLLAQPSDEETLDLTFEDIAFEMEIDSEFSRDYLTPEIEELDGKRISLRGYMLPGTKLRGIKLFILVRDNQECCFGPGAALCDCVLIKLKSGHEVEFTTYPVKVEGTFMLKEKRIGGRVMAIFRMKDCTVSQ